jgi:hypothetical protein
MMSRFPGIVPNRLLEKAILVPSGDQLGMLFPPGGDVSCLSSEPSALVT